MSKYLKKTEAKNAVVTALSQQVGVLGGKAYKRILDGIFEALEDIPAYEFRDAYMERVRVECTD